MKTRIFAIAGAAFLFGLATLCLNGCTKAPITSLEASKTLVATGEALQFSDKSVGKIDSWIWDFGDGTTSTEQNPSHNFSKNGEFSVTLKTENKGGSSVASLVVKVLEPCTANFGAGKNRIATGESVQFNNSSAGDISSYSWDFGDGNKSTDKSATHTYANKGTYTISLTVSNELGSSTAKSQIEVLEPVHADFSTFMVKTKTGIPLKFTDKSIGGVESWQWDFGDGQKSNEQSPSHSYSKGGTYTVTLTVRNAVSTDTVTKKDLISIQSFKISRVEMCSEINNNGEYTVKPLATYNKGEIMWIYLEIAGFQATLKSGGNEIWVGIKRIRFNDPNGSTIIDVANLAEIHQTISGLAGYLWFKIPLGYAEDKDPVGQYSVVIDVIDNISGDQDMANKLLYVK